jgi:hypothetical protein
MIITSLVSQQDTIPRKITANQDTTLGKTDSGSIIVSHQPKDSVRRKAIIQHPNILPDYSDTTTVCSRNIIADVTFYDSNNIIFKIGSGTVRQFPYILTEKARQLKMEERALLIKHLKPGKELVPHPLHADWMIIIILIAAFLFSLIRSSSNSLSRGFARYFLFRGINDPVSRDSGGLFHWQATIMNLISFFIVGLFGYSAATYFNLIPSGSKGIIIWLIALGIICAMVTLRHITCVITGIISEQQEAFKEYLLSVYQSYRFGALFMFVIIILMSYTHILPAGDLIISGLFIVGLIYLIRFIRLLVIFLNRSISIFYLILYLCALEILPVLIVVKYFTGLA